jgi:hypothetical protein
MMNTRNLRYVKIGRAAIGANSWLAIGRLAFGKANLKSVSIDDLSVRRVRVGELEMPPERAAAANIGYPTY